jgi:chemotaxis signal transduction protein
MSESIDVLGIEVGHMLIAVPAEDVLKISKPIVTPIPSTYNWFMGMALYGEDILPVIDIAKLVNPKHKTSRAEFIVVGTKNNPKAYIAIQRVITRFSIKQEELHQKISRKSILNEFTLGTIQTKVSSWSMLDINALLGSELLKKIEINE